jgi:predicted transcriptional regulator
MKVTQVIEAGEVKTFYMSSWSDNQVELTVEGGEIKISLPESVMKRMHKEFGEKLTALAEKRLTEAKEMVESTQEDSDE